MTARVKICGITNVADALAASRAGASAVGLIFAESPRNITRKTAREIINSLPAFVCSVGVFVDASLEEVRETAGELGLHSVQLSGLESPEYVRELSGINVIKCIRVAGPGDLDRADDYDGAHILLDAAVEGVAGGTGRSFPWDLAVELARRRRIILAGGLTPANVAEAVRRVRPWAVDVSSGVEASPGRKDEAKILKFVAAARSVDYAENKG